MLGDPLQSASGSLARRLVIPRERLGDALLLGLQRSRRMAAERIEITADSGDFVDPGLGIDVKQRVERVIVDVQTLEMKITPAWHETDRCLLRVRSALAATDDPFEHSQVVAEAGPEELAVGALAEPVHVEDLRQWRAGLVER